MKKRFIVGFLGRPGRWLSVIKYMARRLIFSFVMLFAACAGTPPGEPADQKTAQPNAEEVQPGAEEPRPYAAERPTAQNREELTISCSIEEIELDFRKSYLAQEAQVYTGLYEGLFSYHPLTMEPVPAVAANWKISDDRKTWTFTIRDGARYWNGDPVRSDDFRAAWLSVMDPLRNSPYSSLFDVISGAKDYRLGIQTDAKTVGVETPDDKTLVVRLVAPASFFPSMLCHHSFSPIHPSMVNVGNWSKSLPVSNGPYRIEKMDSDTMTLVINENYWDAAKIALKKIILLNPKDGDDAAAMWNSGQARWIADDINVEALTDRSGIVVNALFATHYYFIRSGRKPLDNNDVRRSLMLALPWDEIRKDYFLPADTLIYPIPGYPEIEGIAVPDIEEAKRLLSEAGYPDGKGIPDIVIRLSPGMESVRVAGLMAAAWKELGIGVKVEIVESGRYFEALRRDDYDVGASTWIGDFADPYTFLQMFQKDSNLNDARHNDPEYERLMDKSMQEEGAERWSTLAEAEKRLLDYGTVLPISYTPAINIIDTSEINGWYPNVLDIHPYKYFSYKAFRPLPGVALAIP
ncbi:MAG: peptide ABC transporter substrate-binding protein [Spirochaetaceae bacterium]|nr:peptide ABC transporter substrate-binding protein [Spirochaetaceae bacterium]